MAKRSLPEITSMSDQAIAWLVLLHSGKATERDRAEVENWRKRSLRHEQAYAEASRLWRDMGDAMATRLEFPVPALEQRSNTGKYFRRVAGLAVAASVLWLSATPLARYGDRWRSDYHTDIGGRQEVALADGSTVLLDTDSALAVSLDSTRRTIRLYRGQALFRVAPDRQRSFEVVTDTARVKALGTIFEVREEDGGTRVTVIEHAVSLSAEGEGSRIRRIDAGQRAVYSVDEGLSEATEVDVKQQSAWQRGKLIFKNRSLGEVVGELERYLPGRIVITDRDIADLKVSGVFPVDEPEQALDMISKTLRINIVRLSPWLTLLHS